MYPAAALNTLTYTRTEPKLQDTSIYGQSCAATSMHKLKSPTLSPRPPGNQGAGPSAFLLWRRAGSLVAHAVRVSQESENTIC